MEKINFIFFSSKIKGHLIKMEKAVKTMKTPINGARLSSPFGMRKHPIDGFNKCIGELILQPH